MLMFAFSKESINVFKKVNANSKIITKYLEQNNSKISP